MAIGGVSGLVAIYQSLLQTNAAQSAIGGPAQAVPVTDRGTIVVPAPSPGGAAVPRARHAGGSAANAGPPRLDTIA